MIRALQIIMAACLSGCAMFPAAVVDTPAQPELEQFALNGRISISHQGERYSAGLRWTHLDASDEILLLAPLGQTAARVYQDAAGATLESDGEHFQAEDLEMLMQQVLRWHLPLDGLHHWVLGLPAMGSESHVVRDPDGRVRTLSQDGWEVRYLRYTNALPSRLQLNHEDLQVQLLIDAWDWDTYRETE